MSDTDQNQDTAPQIDESKIQELAEQRAAEIARERYKDWVSPDDVKGLVNKRDELLEKTAKFKNVTVEQLEQFQKDQERRQSDEVYKMVVEGKYDEAMQLKFGPQIDAWKEKISGQEEQLTTLQGTLEQERQLRATLEQDLINNRKESYLSKLTAEDDSFRGSYFSEFYQLYKDKIEFDTETGAVYALKDGKRIVDADGNHVKFEKQYAKVKAENGLFWKGGQGTNTRGGKGGDTSKPFNKMTTKEKAELRAEIGDDEFRKLVLSSAKK